VVAAAVRPEVCSDVLSGDACSKGAGYNDACRKCGGGETCHNGTGSGHCSSGVSGVAYGENYQQ
jgi:hypothetical protein